MAAANSNDDVLIFQEETKLDNAADKAPEMWNILVVDDDEQVHKVTSLALSNIQIHGKRLSFLHAYSSRDALDILQNDPGISVILLDVVMESDDAGLQLVKTIREDLGNEAIRIILRTGQPGYAPELEVIQQYDINDYKMKSELTRTRLITTITTAVRSYDQIRAIEVNRRGLEFIIKGMNDLFLEYDPHVYSKGILGQLVQILPELKDAVVLWAPNPGAEPEVLVVFREEEGQPRYSGNADVDRYRQLMLSCKQANQPFFGPDGGGVLLEPSADHRFYLLFHIDRACSDQDQRLFRVLCANALVGFQNLNLIQGLERFAYFDQLTGLPNKNKFTELIETLTAKNREPQAVAIVDIDDFSEINDSLGFESGDQLLKAVAQRLTHLADDQFTVARISGDTFGVLGPENMLKPQLIMNIFEEPFLIRDMPFPIRITMGLAKLEEVQDAEEGIKSANIAMKRAKSSARSRFLYFSEAMQDAIHRRISISRDLKPALLNGEFLLHYQPQISLESNKVVGTEALIRWKKPNGELVPPFHFIGVAESSGLINDIGKWSFQEACRSAKGWNESRDSPIRIAVNVSMRQFHSPSFLPFIDHVLTDTGIDPGLVEIEITESLVMQDAERVIDILKRIKSLGISIAIDDFGTGFSSLNYLLRLPIDRLKIDRSFILNLQTDRRSHSLTELVINLGKQLDLRIIAEGVENAEQAEIVKRLGCHEVQGFLYSKPIPGPEFLNWKDLWNSGS